MRKNYLTYAALISALSLSAAACSKTDKAETTAAKTTEAATEVKTEASAVTEADTTEAGTTEADTTEAETEEKTEAVTEADTAEADSKADTADAKTFKIGICNYVDDASLNQIVANIEKQLGVLEEDSDGAIVFEVTTENCMADATVLDQIIANFIADDVDLMVGVATPVAMAMQAATEDNQIPVVFAAVSDPVASGLVESLEEPGANITGTSDYLDTTAVMNLLFAADEEADHIALLFDQGQDSSTTAIAQAKEYLDEKEVKYTEYTGTTVDEVMLAVDSIIADGANAVFTPSDNTIMTAELSIYEKLAEAGIPHYAGADSFALNGAFCGYGVDYINLGIETANMINSILVDGEAPAKTPVMTFDNGIATINTEVCDQLGYDFDEISEVFEPLCTAVKGIETAEEFEEETEEESESESETEEE